LRKTLISPVEWMQTVGPVRQNLPQSPGKIRPVLVVRSAGNALARPCHGPALAEEAPSKRSLMEKPSGGIGREILIRGSFVMLPGIFGTARARRDLTAERVGGRAFAATPEHTTTCPFPF
jgi:hypothetical protein